jgi:hypothetical protein
VRDQGSGNGSQEPATEKTRPEPAEVA